MKKLILFLAIFSALFCLLMMSVSAETPSLYIEFGVRISGSDSYVAAYAVERNKDGESGFEAVSYNSIVK